MKGRTLVQALTTIAACAIAGLTLCATTAGAVALAGDPAAVVPAGSTGVMDVFGRGSDAHLWRREYRNGTWAPWQDLGAPAGGMQGRPSAVSWYDGHLDVMVRGADDYLYHRYLVNGSWSDWLQIAGGQISSSPKLIAWGNGREDVFVRGASNSMLHAAVDLSLNGGQWYPLEDLGGQFTSGPSVLTWQPGHLDVFGRGNDGYLWHKYWYNSSWSAWSELASGWPIASGAAPQAVTWGSGQEDVFSRGGGNNLWHVAFVDSMGGWGTPEDLGGVISSDPAPVTWGSGQMDAFAAGSGTDPPLWHRWMDLSTTGGSYYPWAQLGSQTTAGSPAAVTWGSGNITVFTRTPSGDYAADMLNSTWGSWVGLGHPDVTAPTVTSVSGDLADLAGGVVYEEPYSLQAAASDDQGISSVDVLVDGAPFASSASAQPSFDLDLSSLSLGDHTIAVRATDTSGNTSTSAPFTVTRANYDAADRLETVEPDDPTASPTDVPSCPDGTSSCLLPEDAGHEPSVDSNRAFSLSSDTLPELDGRRIYGVGPNSVWLGLSEAGVSPTGPNATITAAQSDLQQSGPVRFTVPFDIANPADADYKYLDDVLAAAQAVKSAGGNVMISFEHRYDGDPAYRPTLTEYAGDMQDFLARAGATVTYYTAWNEPDNRTQPWQLLKSSTQGGATIAGELFRILHGLCAKASWTCVVLAGDMTDNDSGHLFWNGYFSAYEKAIATDLPEFDYDLGQPGRWAIHLYRESNWSHAAGEPGCSLPSPTDSRSLDDSFFQKFLAHTDNRPVWITEVGSIVLQTVSGVVKHDTTCNTGRQQAHFWDAMTLAAESPRVERLYYYHYRNGDGNWDSGLLDAQQSPRISMRAYKYLLYLERNTPHVDPVSDRALSGPDPSISFTGPSVPIDGVTMTTQCQLDGGAWAPCTSPVQYSGLGEGGHKLAVRTLATLGDATTSSSTSSTTTTSSLDVRAATVNQSDASGQPDDTVTQWTVDATPPDTSVTSAPGSTIGSPDASIGFSGTDNSGVQSYECQLDGGGWSACTSPKTYTGLAAGPHEVDVRAIDVVGLVDGSPAQTTWTYDPSFPNNTEAPTTSGAAQVGQVLTAAPGTWTGSSPSYSYQWMRCDSTGKSCSATGGTASTYKATLYDANKYLEVVVKATNSTGSSSATSALSPAVRDYPAVVKGDTAESYWRLGEAAGATSAVNAGSSGTAAATYGPSGSTAFGAEGAVPSNTALSLSGAGGGLLGGQGPALDGSFTVEAWVRTNPGWKPASGTMGAVVAKWHAWNLSILDDGHAASTDWGGNHQYDSGVAVDDGAWHDVAMTVNGNTLTVYVDGQARISGTWSAGSGTSSKVSIGAGTDDSYGSTLGDSLKGFVDEVSTYETTLSADQLAAHYLAATTGRPANTAAPTVSGTAQVGQTLTASNGSWSWTTGYQYQWERCSSSGDQCTPISGAMSSTYTATRSDSLKKLGVLVKGTNAVAGAYAMSAVTASVKSYPYVVLGDSPESYWRLGDAAGSTSALNQGSSRVSATPYGGTDTSSLAFGAPGEFSTDGALSSTGQGRGLLGGQGPAMDGTFSVEAWVKTASGWTPPAGTTGDVVAKWQAWSVSVLGNGHAGTLSWGGSSQVDSGVAVNDGAWHDVVVVVNGAAPGNLTIYVDGVSRATGDWLLGDGSRKISIAAGTDDSYGPSLGNSLAGTVDDVSVYPGALTAPQVQAHWAAATT